MTDRDEQLKLSNQICFRLYKASKAMTRVYQPLLESLNLTYPQYITMLVLWEEHKTDFKQLGKRLDMKTGTLTPIIQKLERMDLVARERNESDNRKIWVSLTPSGAKLREKASFVPELLLKNMNMNLDQYFKYVSVLDEISGILTLVEKKQKN